MPSPAMPSSAPSALMGSRVSYIPPHRHRPPHGEEYMGKRLLFIGAGAVGSYIGAFLSRAGHDVTLVDPWSDQVEAIRQHGISVTGPHEPFEARPAALHLHEAA